MSCIPLPTRAGRALATGLAAIVVMVGCQKPDFGRPPPTPPIVSSPATVVEFDAAEFSFTGPDRLPAGMVTMRMNNHGQEPHHGQLLRLHDGVSFEEFVATLQRGEQEAQLLVSIDGGPGLTDPHGSAEVSLELQPGTYVLACFVPGADGLPHLAKGMLKPIQVVPGPGGWHEPQVAANFTARDFGFDMPDELPGGRATYRVTNVGPQPHEVGIIKLAPGASVADALAFYRAPAGQPPFQSIGGINGLGAGKSGFMTLDLQPGAYAAVCLIPDPSSGMSHVDLGMIKRFTVKG